MNSKSYVTVKSLSNFKVSGKNNSFLKRLDMELTWRCNNSCIHCYVNLPAEDVLAKEGELSTEEVKEILKEAESLGCITVKFTGGEPLLRKDFGEIYVFARKIGLRAAIFTNGTLITEEMAELFSIIPPMEKIEVTLYGMSEESCERVTGRKGVFSAAMNGINLLLSRNVPFVLKWALLPQNRHDINEFEKLASSVPWMRGLPSYSMFFNLSCNNPKKNELIKNLRISPEDGLNFITRKKENYISEVKKFLSFFSSPPGGRLFTCNGGKTTCSVDPAGKLQMCLLYREPSSLYDLKNGSLKEGIGDFFSVIRERKSKNPDYLERCGKCFLKNFCDQCPAKSWSETGTPDSPVEYLCDITHRQAVYLGLLKEWEKSWEIDNPQERVKNFLNIREAV